MLLLRRLPRVTVRLFAQKAAEKKETPKRLVRVIDPVAIINICTDVKLEITALNIFKYTKNNAFIAHIVDKPDAKTPSATLDVDFSEDKKEIDVCITKCKNVEDTDGVVAKMEVPSSASVYIDAKEAVTVSFMYGLELDVRTDKDILLRDLHADYISAVSGGGNIKCEGLVMSRRTNIETVKKGNITLTHLQGQWLRCRTDAGDISVQSCYVRGSKFATVRGDMQLNNVHKKTEVLVHNKGNVNMMGIESNINLRARGGSLDLHFAGVSGDCLILTEGVEHADVNIAEYITKLATIDVKAGEITLNDSLSQFAKSLSQDKKSLCIKPKKNYNIDFRMNIQCGDLILGKRSWADSMIDMVKKEQEKEKEKEKERDQEKEQEKC